MICGPRVSNYGVVLSCCFILGRFFVSLVLLKGEVHFGGVLLLVRVRVGDSGRASAVGVGAPMVGLLNGDTRGVFVVGVLGGCVPERFSPVIFGRLGLEYNGGTGEDEGGINADGILPVNAHVSVVYGVFVAAGAATPTCFV